MERLETSVDAFGRWRVKVFSDEGYHVDTFYPYDTRLEALAAVEREYPGAVREEE